MAAGKYSFVIEKGATTDFEILYKDASGTPIDLKDNQARMQLRAEQTGSSALYLTLSSSLNSDGTGLNISGSGGNNPPESGSIGIFISYLTSSTLDFERAFYDLEIASGSGINTKVTRILEGQVQVSKNITTGSF
tara:strand:+ start:48 stop:452 length:405 start_codon:yes stop_codon:yes gene_type:complete